MKKRLSLVLLLVASSLVGVSCSKTKAPTSSIIDPANVDKLYVADTVDKDAIYLNITETGLYNGERGTLLTSSNIEYGVALSNLKVGDALPTSEVTSRAKGVSFLTWCYYGGDGMLSYTTSVVNGVNLYHAVFQYTGTYDGNYYYTDGGTTTSSASQTVTTSSASQGGTPTTSSQAVVSSSEDVAADIQRYYFVDASWWNEAAAATNVVLYKGTQPSGLGVKMSYVAYDATTKTNTWYVDVDLNQYDKAVFIRVNGTGTEDWGARTASIDLTKEYNTIKLTDVAKWYGNGATAQFTTSIVDYK